MVQNEPYRFIFESELLEILGEYKVSVIKNCGLEEIFDGLYGYYIEYHKDWKADIIRAYDAILYACVNMYLDDIIMMLSKVIFEHTKGEQKE